MGRGISGVAEAPAHDGEGTPAESDQNLVARVRRGDDRAFELLYQRYHRRIHAYVLGMVKDHGRAEDVTQEVFVSALRRMRETEQPLAFKPWLYQIAKNSCIDAFRRSKRTEEVSIDADECLAPSDHSRLVSSGPTPDAAVAAKQEIDDLCGAFGGLSETHHEILVLRELEGLSYQEIGQRMGMSRPAVESTLFRARRRLTEEFDDIVSGARCQRIQTIIVTAVESRLGARDTRRLARHLAHCQPCRREALAAGLDRELFTRPTMRERVATKVASFLPLPAFLRFRRDADAPPPPHGGRMSSLTSHLPMYTEQLSTGWGKAAAGAAVLVAGVGAGVGVQQVVAPAERPAATRSQVPVKPAAAPKSVVRKQAAPSLAGDSTQTSTRATSSRDERAGRERKSGSRADSRRAATDNNSPAAADKATPGGGTPAQQAEGRRSADGSSKPEAKAKRRATAPIASPVATRREPVRETNDAIRQTTNTVTETTKKATEQIDDAAQQLPAAGPVPGVVDQATDAAEKTVKAVGDGVDEAAGNVGGTIGGLGGG